MHFTETEEPPPLLVLDHRPANEKYHQIPATENAHFYAVKDFFSNRFVRHATEKSRAARVALIFEVNSSEILTASIKKKNYF